MIRRLILVLVLLTPTTSFAAPNYLNIVIGTIGSVIHYYRFGESSGTAAVDYCNTGTNCGINCAGSCLDGTYTGGFTLGTSGAISGDSNTAVTLNGSTGYVAVPVIDIAGNITHPNNTKNFGVAIWFKPSAAGDLVSQSNGSTTGVWRLRYSGTTVLFRIYTNASSCNTSGIFGDALTVNTYSTGAWHLAIASTTQNGTSLTHQKVFVDGVLGQDNTSFSGTMCTTNMATDVGRWPLPTANNFNGTLDESTWFGDMDWTTAKAAQMYACGIQASCTGTSPVWPFTVEAPKLPQFRDNGYSDAMVARGYNTGHLDPRVMRPQLLNVAWLPFTEVPSGNTSHRSSWWR